MRASGVVERLAAMAQRRLPRVTPVQLASALEALALLQFRAPASFLQVRASGAAGDYVACCRT